MSNYYQKVHTQMKEDRTYLAVSPEMKAVIDINKPKDMPLHEFVDKVLQDGLEALIIERCKMKYNNQYEVSASLPVG